LNVHASLLPRWRGAAPIERSLLAGDRVSGVTIMQMDEGLDTGAMLYKETVEITSTDNRIDLEEKLQIAGQTALLKTLSNLERFQSESMIQSDEASNYAAKLEKSEAFIDWRLSAPEIDRQIRAGIGRNPAYTILNDQRLRILEGSVSMNNSNAKAGQIVESVKTHFAVSCGSGTLQVQRVQLPGKKPASVKDINNSRPELFSRDVTFTCEQPK
jgi:methionyl-tRNA formyltransferase